jgi:hypothetical protein
VGINFLLLFSFVEIFKFHFYIICGILIRIRTYNDVHFQIEERNVSQLSIIPVYSGKQIVRGDLLIFSSKRSFLLRNKIIDVSTNHFELQMESNNFIDSIILFISSSSANTRSYPKCCLKEIVNQSVPNCILCQKQLTRQRDTKNDCCNSFKAVNPFLSLRSLSANVKHSKNANIR